MAGLFDPPPPGNMTTSSGKISDAAYNWFRSLGQNLASAVSGVSDLNGEVIVMDFAIEHPLNQDYPLELSAPYGYTISRVDSQCIAGSCTATIKIGGVALGGGGNSVSTTLQTINHTSANVMAAAGSSVVTVSANSSCDRLKLTIWTTRS
jgi:hypothetical protein